MQRIKDDHAHLHVPAGLSHHPDGRALNRIAAQRAQHQRRIRGGRGSLGADGLGRGSGDGAADHTARARGALEGAGERSVRAVGGQQAAGGAAARWRCSALKH
jgi:hypothetical protein